MIPWHCWYLDVFTWPPLCFQLCQGVISYQLKKFQVKVVSGSTIFRKSLWRHHMTTIMFSTMSRYHMLSTDQVLSQTAIRKYDFQEVAVTSLWRHQMAAIMISTMSRYHMLSNEQVLSQTTIRKYHFQKVTMTALWRHH